MRKSKALRRKGREEGRNLQNGNHKCWTEEEKQMCQRCRTKNKERKGGRLGKEKQEHNGDEDKCKEELDNKMKTKDDKDGELKGEGTWLKSGKI